jgi:hypothetical protein
VLQTRAWFGSKRVCMARNETIQEVAARLGTGYEDIVWGVNPVREHYGPDGTLESREILMGNERTRFKAQWVHIRQRGSQAGTNMRWLVEYFDALAVIRDPYPNTTGWAHQPEKEDFERALRSAKRFLGKSRKSMPPKMRAKVEARWPVIHP